MDQLYELFAQRCLSGEIAVHPLKNACTFCDYKGICHHGSDTYPNEPLVMKDVKLKRQGTGGKKKK